MNSLCWPSAAKKIIQKEKEAFKVRYTVVFIGLWALNATIAFFGMPFFIYRVLKRK